jgi:SAM-dependent methyltransferase
LCLAAGGGRHGPLYAAAGANVIVVDLSAEMLALDRQAAAEGGYDIRTVQASMDPVYREVARVLAPGGLYISQHKQPVSLQADARPSTRGYEIIEGYYRSGPLPTVEETLHRETGTLEFLHRWEELVGEMCRAGFVIEDLVEPCHARRDAQIGQFGHRSQFVAPYVRIKARRTSQRSTTAPPVQIDYP